MKQIWEEDIITVEPLTIKEFQEYYLQCYRSSDEDEKEPINLLDFVNLLPAENPDNFCIKDKRTYFSFFEQTKNCYVFFTFGDFILFNYENNKFKSIQRNFWVNSERKEEKCTFYFVNQKIIVETKEDNQTIFRLLTKINPENPILQILVAERNDPVESIIRMLIYDKERHPVLLKKTDNSVEYYYGNIRPCDNKHKFDNKSPKNNYVTFEEIFRLTGLTKVPFDQLKKYLPVYKKMGSSNIKIFEKNLFKTILEYVF
jgi:hypothetical protein